MRSHRSAASLSHVSMGRGLKSLGPLGSSYRTGWHAQNFFLAQEV
jgi:hypothetical protein